MTDINHSPSATPSFLSNRLYDRVRFLALYVLPAIGAAYFSLSEIWGLPMAAEVVGTITVVDTLLGALVGVAKRQYESSDDRFDGTIVLTEDVENELTNMDVSLNPDSISRKKELRVRVKEA